MRISGNVLHFVMQSILILNSPAYRTWCSYRELKRLRSNDKSPNLSRRIPFHQNRTLPECGIQCCGEENDCIVFFPGNRPAKREDMAISSNTDTNVTLQPEEDLH